MTMLNRSGGSSVSALRRIRRVQPMLKQSASRDARRSDTCTHLRVVASRKVSTCPPPQAVYIKKVFLVLLALNPVGPSPQATMRSYRRQARPCRELDSCRRAPHAKPTRYLIPPPPHRREPPSQSRP